MSPRFGRMSEFAGLMVVFVPPVSMQLLASGLQSSGIQRWKSKRCQGTIYTPVLAQGHHDTAIGTWPLTSNHMQAGPASDSQDSMYFDAEDELPASPSSSDGEAHGNDFVAAFSASLQRLTSKNRSSMNDRVRLRVQRGSRSAFRDRMEIFHLPERPRFAYD